MTRNGSKHVLNIKLCIVIFVHYVGGFSLKYRITVERKTFRMKFVDGNDIHALLVYPTHNIHRSSATLFVRKLHKSITLRTFPNCAFNNKPYSSEHTRMLPQSLSDDNNERSSHQNW